MRVLICNAVIVGGVLRVNILLVQRGTRARESLLLLLVVLVAGSIKRVVSLLLKLL